MHPVVIAGAGPVGKVLALQLAQYDIESVLVDPGEGIAPGARARMTNARTMEHLRRLGIADRVRELAPLPRDYPVRSVYLTRIAGGHVLAEFRGAYASAPDDRYPEPSQYTPQDRLEQALLESVRRQPMITLAFGERVERFDVASDRVRVGLDSGRVLEGRYLIGCDGGGSTVRKRLGAQLQGERGIMSSVSVELRSRRLREIIDQAGIGRATQHWLLNPEAPVLISAMDGRETWTMLYMHGGKGLEVGDPRKLFRTAVGTDDVDIEILEVTPWSGHRLIADSYGAGRVLIAGDAAHMHPPTGGYGMNTGIGDAINIAWKIGAVEAGWGDPGLLETYEQERRPIHERVIAEAVGTSSVLPEQLVTDDRLNADTQEAADLRATLRTEILRVKARQHQATGVILGDRYDDSPLVIPDGSPREPPQTTDFTPSARPGARLPHVWLGENISLYDRLDRWFTLLDLSGNPAAPGAIATGVPIARRHLDNPGLRAKTGADYVLVRPDMHVAWRGDSLPDPDKLGLRISGAALSADNNPA